MVHTRRELAERVLPYSDESAGLHAVRLFKDGSWRTVVVDDQLPCHGKGRPAYSTNSEPRDGPVALVSKALAKLYGCYEDLKVGRVGSALEDLTGGISDKIYLRDGVLSASSGLPKQPHISALDEVSSGVMWARLSALLSGGHLLGACFKPKYASLGGKAAIECGGLVYPLVEMKEAQGSQYVRLRNVYKGDEKGGKPTAREWEGAWGPASAEWQNLPGVASALGGKPRDGSFWMSWQDFISGFNKVHVCRILSQQWCVERASGEWTLATAGGRISTWPGTGWRRNPQHGLKLSERTTIVLAIAQPDAQTDANDASDAYPNAIGFSVLGAPTPPAARQLLLTTGDLRHDSRLACTRQVSATMELEAGEYTIVPYTMDPNTYLPYELTAASTSPLALTTLPDATTTTAVTLRGTWAEGTMAGGCPNQRETWTQNPQWSVSVEAGGPCSAIAVMSLALEPSVSEQLLQRAQSITLAAQAAQAAGDDAKAASLQEQLAALAPAIGFIVLRGDGGLLSYPAQVAQEDICCASPYAHGTQEVGCELSLEPGAKYTLVASTFEPGIVGSFNLQLFPTSGDLKLSPLNGGQVLNASEAATRAGGARPQGFTGPPGGGGKRVERPVAKHDVSALRSGDDDDGKIGYAQRMELEEEKAMERWVENLPRMTIEGQPLSENVKKKKEALVASAVAYCNANGTKFEDSGEGGFPTASGHASSPTQPAVYSGGGLPTANMPTVTQWLRPEEFAPEPTLFKNTWEVEGIVQGAGMDNKWFVSALNIVAGNRGQLDRIFFGEVDDTWIEYGFFVCKFYQDDPYSDDDWQVVIVDDRIPCGADGKPVFCRNPDPNVYWAMIIEKAYAKFCGCYEAMQGGTVTQGLEDLTGGIGYKFDLEKKEKEWIPPNGEIPEKLWDEIMEKMKTEHVVGCSNNTKGQPRPLTTKKGILLNRAYAIVTGGEFEDNLLLRLRVPLDEHGAEVEWNGRWSDESAAWNSRLAQMLHYSRNTKDGTFWMEYKDLCKHFNKVYMCRMLDDLWTRFTVKSRWMDS